MRPSVLAVSLTLLAMSGCGDVTLSTPAGGTGGAPLAGAGGTGGILSSGGTGVGGVPSTGVGGTSAVLPSGGAGGAAGAFSTGAGGTSLVPSSGGVGGRDAALSSGGAGGRDAALTGGAEVTPATGGAVGMDADLSSGETNGTVDVREADAVVDSTGEAGGASGKNILDLVPLDNMVSGWKVDRTVPTSGQRAVVATNQQELESLIDGGAIPFYTSPYQPKVFAWQNYVNETLRDALDGAHVSLYVVQMPSAEDAAGLYKALLGFSEYSRKVGTPDDWQDPTSPRLGTDSRIQDTGSQWWVNFYKDAFYVEVMLDPSYGPAPDYVPGSPALKAEALRFAQVVASRL
jgi:hypothetical protein